MHHTKYKFFQNNGKLAVFLCSAPWFIYIFTGYVKGEGCCH